MPLCEKPVRLETEFHLAVLTLLLVFYQVLRRRSTWSHYPFHILLLQQTHDGGAERRAFGSRETAVFNRGFRSR